MRLLAFLGFFAAIGTASAQTCEIWSRYHDAYPGSSRVFREHSIPTLRLTDCIEYGLEVFHKRAPEPGMTITHARFTQGGKATQIRFQSPSSAIPSRDACGGEVLIQKNFLYTASISRSRLRCSSSLYEDRELWCQRSVEGCLSWAMRARAEPSVVGVDVHDVYFFNQRPIEVHYSIR